MILKEIVIENFKYFKHFELEFNDSLSILVGDNETGKSTLLESINLCLTGQLNGRSAIYELSPYLFNKSIVSEYIKKLREGQNVPPPSIRIEVFLDDLPGKPVHVSV